MKPQQPPRHAEAWRGEDLNWQRIAAQTINAKGKQQSNEFEESNCEPAPKRSIKGVELLSRGQIKARKRDAPNLTRFKRRKDKEDRIAESQAPNSKGCTTWSKIWARSEVPERHWRLQQMHQLRIKLNDERQGRSKSAASEVACHESSRRAWLNTSWVVNTVVMLWLTAPLPARSTKSASNNFEVQVTKQSS